MEKASPPRTRGPAAAAVPRRGQPGQARSPGGPGTGTGAGERRRGVGPSRGAGAELAKAPEARAVVGSRARGRARYPSESPRAPAEGTPPDARGGPAARLPRKGSRPAPATAREPKLRDARGPTTWARPAGATRRAKERRMGPGRDASPERPGGAKQASETRAPAAALPRESRRAPRGR